MVNLPCKRLQLDEIWSFVYAKEKNVPDEMKGKGAGDVWTWTALDSETKLVPCWFIGDRSAGSAWHFVHDLQPRLASRVQVTTDGLKAYLSAVESAFGAEVDYAMLIKIYGNQVGPAMKRAEIRYIYGDSFDASKNKPSWVGGWTNKFIYNPLYQSLPKELKAKRAAYCGLSGKDPDFMRLHQFLESHAKDELKDRITRVITLLQLSGSKHDFAEHYVSLFHGRTQLKLDDILDADF